MADLNKVSTDDLKKKQKALNGLKWMLIVLAFLLFVLPLRDYWKGEELDMATITIAICCLGGMFSLVPQLSAIEKELDGRNV